MPPRARVRFPAGGNATEATTLSVDGDIQLSTNVLPCKEWSITDDCLNVSDSASFTISNIDGEHSGRFAPGQSVIVDVREDGVAGGDWVRTFTGILVSVESGSDLSGGSVILLSAMDVGWCLTSCHARPLTQIKNLRFVDLIKRLIDPTWPFKRDAAGNVVVVADNQLNRRIRHGRQVIVQNNQVTLGAVLPFIQVEPGQAPFDILQTYAAREGVLINVGGEGQLIFFRPNYMQPALYAVEYHGSMDDRRRQNNIIGRPTLRESIDGLYTEAQCWSTVVIPPAQTGTPNTDNPNEIFRHETYRPDQDTNLPADRRRKYLPFERRMVFSDGEAINKTLRRNRAIWKSQMGLFNSWQYEVDFDSHSQNGGFFVSDTMISVNDSVHRLDAVYYVQAVRRSQTIREGTRAHLTLRKPGLLNPELQELRVGGGAKKAAKAPKVIK